MDDDVADVVSTELKEFFDVITTPFLDKLPALDRVQAISWSERVMNIRNYPLMKKYLLLLAFMIIGGRIVPPFNADPRRRRLPPFWLDFKDIKIFNYVQEEIERVKSQETREQTQSALSNDEKAFLALLPSPRNGVRLYLATSNEPYSEWSRSRNFPAPTKYDVSRSEFVNGGLALVQKKFETYQKSKPDGEQPQKTESRSRPSPESDDPGSVDDRSETPSSGRRSLHQQTQDRQNETVIRVQPRECVVEISPNERAVIREFNDVVTDDLPDLIPSTATEDDQRKEELVQMKADRWFDNLMYDSYRETIRKLLRKNLSVDTIRRNIHRCMRQRYSSSAQIPHWMRDSLDESEPPHIRMEHLRTRFADVLKNEYGMTDDEEIFCLTSMVSYSADKEQKARELIKRAEEGRVDPRIRQIMRNERRSCGYLLRLVDDLLAATEREHTCPDGPCTSDYPDSDEAWPPTEPSHVGSTFYGLHSSTSTAYPPSRTSTNGSTSMNGSLNQTSRTERSIAGTYTDASVSIDDSSDQSRRSSRTTKTEIKSISRNEQSAHACCPPGHPTWMEQKKEIKSATTSYTSTDFNLEDVTPTELFERLPPDTSEEDTSNESKNNNKKINNK